MKSLLSTKVLYLLFSHAISRTFAIECFECIGFNALTCSLATKVTCSGSCHYLFAQSVNGASMSFFARGCMAVGDTRLDGCADMLMASSGISNTTLQCYQCNGVGCRSPKIVWCNGACIIDENSKGDIVKSCVTHAEILSNFEKNIRNIKFTGCVTKGTGASRTERYMCHENLCNKDAKTRCTFTVVPASVQEVSTVGASRLKGVSNVGASTWRKVSASTVLITMVILLAM